MSVRNVIVTRPLAQAQEFVAKVNAISRSCQLFPLLEIHPLEDQSEIIDVVAHLSHYALVVFVSPNAIDAFFSHVRQWPPQLPIGVVGEGSRLALARHGVNSDNSTIICPSDKLKTDSEALAAEIDFAALAGKQVLLVRGTTGREFLADAFRSRGVSVKQLAAYRRSAPEFSISVRTQLDALLQSDNDWVITSSEALRTLILWCGQLSGDNAVAKIQHQHLIVPHVRIAETAQVLGFHSITLTASGDEQVLVALQSSV